MTNIQGASVLGPQGYLWAEHWARERGASIYAIENAQRYWAFAPLLNLRPEVVFAHHCKETAFGNYTGVLDPSYHNCAGLKTRAGGNDYRKESHEKFPSWEAGVIAHVNHLAAYVYGRNFIPLQPIHSRLVLAQSTPHAGTVDQVEELDGRWAPGKTYGHDLVRIFIDPLVEYGLAGIRYVQATKGR